MISTLTYEALDSMQVQDVTGIPEKAEAAFHLVANKYAEFSSRGLDTEEVYNELCQDKYHQKGQARTIILEGINPYKTGDHLEMLATVRMIIGSDIFGPDLYPLEAMNLITPPGGWEGFAFHGFDPYQSVEYGRFIVHPDCRRGVARDQGFHLLVTREIAVKAYQIAVKQFAKSQVWSIMSPLVANIVKSCGIDLSQVPEIELNYGQNKALFERYDRYWIKKPIGYYKLMNLDVLTEFTSGT